MSVYKVVATHMRHDSFALVSLLRPKGRLATSSLELLASSAQRMSFKLGMGPLPPDAASWWAECPSHQMQPAGGVLVEETLTELPYFKGRGALGRDAS